MESPPGDSHILTAQRGRHQRVNTHFFQCSAGSALNARTSVLAEFINSVTLGNWTAKVSATRSHAAKSSAGSGWINTVRRAAATMSAEPLGTLASAFSVHWLTSRRYWDGLKRGVRPIYTAVNADAARMALDELAGKRGARYPRRQQLHHARRVEATYYRHNHSAGDAVTHQTEQSQNARRIAPGRGCRSAQCLAITRLRARSPPDVDAGNITAH
jgi:hypothetical protein